MTFLAMIIALVLQQAWGGSNPVHTDDWYRSWYSEVRRWGVPPAIKLTLAVLAPALLAYVILDALEPVLFGLLWIGAAVWLLVYALGRGDFREQMDNYRRQCLGGNFEGAFLAAGAQMGHAAEGEDPASEEEVHCMVQRALLYEGFQRWFAVLFWFFVLGPAGALAYRLLQLCHDELEPELAARRTPLPGRLRGPVRTARQRGELRRLGRGPEPGVHRPAQAQRGRLARRHLPLCGIPVTGLPIHPMRPGGATPAVAAMLWRMDNYFICTTHVGKNRC